MAIGILGVGAHVPSRMINNDVISAWASTDPHWIAERTGMTARRYADRTVRTSDLALAAVHDLERRRGDALEDLALVIVATSTPDQPQPATAAIVQGRLGIGQVPAVDLNSVCAGFLFALDLARSYASTNPGRVLVVAADKYSAIMDSGDRRTVSLFGDGSGAVLVGAVPDGYGILASHLVTAGQYSDYVEVEGGGTRLPLDAAALSAGKDRFRMKGRAVAEYALKTLPELIHGVLDDAGMSVADVDRYIMHQANPRLLETLARTLGIDVARMPMPGRLYGNSGAASLPVTLWHSHREHPLRRGERIMLGAVGGGMSAGATVLTWY